VRGLDVAKALDILKFDRKPSARDVGKAIASAAANARQKAGVREDRLYVKKVMVNAGPMLKRFMPRARGSASSIMKRQSHLVVIVDERI
jgi:large subunit ribosomal protein L22